jgi:hypothetical protein
VTDDFYPDVMIGGFFSMSPDFTCRDLRLALVPKDALGVPARENTGIPVLCAAFGEGAVC